MLLLIQRFKLTQCVFILFILIITKATFTSKPLTLQYGRYSISSNRFINRIHFNPFFDLYKSYKEKLELSNFDKLSFLKKFDADNFSKSTPHSILKYNKERGLYSIEQKVSPTLGKILKKKPKHIVLVFMESYSLWPIEYPNIKIRQ